MTTVKKSPEPGKGVKDLMKTSMNMPRGLWKRFRVRALEEGRDAQDIVAALLEEYLKRPKKGGRDASR